MQLHPAASVASVPVVFRVPVLLIQRGPVVVGVVLDSFPEFENGSAWQQNLKIYMRLNKLIKQEHFYRLGKPKVFEKDSIFKLLCVAEMFYKHSRLLPLVLPPGESVHLILAALVL